MKTVHKTSFYSAVPASPAPSYRSDMASQATAVVIPGSPAPSYRSVDGEQRKFQFLVLVSFKTRTFGEVKRTLRL